jgi:predicted O-methyltransferase YrrM
VADALALSRTRGFLRSCRVETGRLLASLAASRSGTIGETGTGCGVGAAWLYSGLRTDARLVTAEVDPELAAQVARLFDDERVHVLADDWHALTESGPFSLLFVDSREPKTLGPDGVVDFLDSGSIAILDDFTPTSTWPPTYAGQVDVLRQSWLTDPRFVTSEVMVTPDASVLVATKR